MKGGGINLDSSAPQSIGLNQACCRSSSNPSPDLHANRRDGSRSRNYDSIRVTVGGGDNYTTYTSERLYGGTAAFLIRIIRETQMISCYAICQIRVCLALERSTSEKKFVGTDTERPPVDGVGVAAFGKNFGSHICHASCDARQWSTFRKMHGNVEVC